MRLNRLLSRFEFVVKYSAWGTFVCFLASVGIYYYFYASNQLKDRFPLASHPVDFFLDDQNIFHLSFYGFELFDFVFQLLDPFGLHVLYLFLASLLFSFLIAVTFTSQKSKGSLKRGSFTMNSLKYLKYFHKQFTSPSSLLSKKPKGLPFGVGYARFAFGKLPVPIFFENLGILGFGSPGTGKSVQLIQMIKGQSFYRRRVFSLYSLLSGELNLYVYYSLFLVVLSMGVYLYPSSLRFALSFDPEWLFVVFIALILPYFLFLIKKENLQGIEDSGGILYDRADLTEKLFNEKRGDLLLDPMDQRSVRPNIFLDLKNDASIRAFCEGFFPSTDDPSSEIWKDLSQNLLEAILKCVILEAKDDQRNPTMKDLSDFMMNSTGIANLDRMRGRLKKYPVVYNRVSDLILDIGDKVGKTTESAFISFSSKAKIFINPIWSAPLLNGQTEFSFKDFLSELKDPDRPKRWLFMRNKAEYSEAYKKLYSAFLNMFFSAIISLEKESQWPRIQLVIDEWASLPKINLLSSLTNEGRKFGVFPLFFTQSPSQIEKVYGKSEANSIFGGIQTKIIFRQADSKGAVDIQTMIGEQEIELETVSTNLGESRMQAGATTQQTLQTKKSVLASELSHLKEFQFYCSFPGHPWMKGKVLNLFHPSVNFVPFIKAPYSDIDHTTRKDQEDPSAHEDPLIDPSAFLNEPELVKEMPVADQQAENPSQSKPGIVLTLPDDLNLDLDS